jgi:hypothetical protein
MRAKSFFKVLIIFMMMMAPGVLFGQKRGGASELSLRQKVDVETTNLVRNIKKTKELKPKVELTKKFLKKIKDLRAENPIQLPGDEIYMDMLVGSMEELPSSESFKVDSCDQYKSKIMSLYDPRSGVKSQNPALNHTFEVIDGLCAK